MMRTGSAARDGVGAQGGAWRDAASRAGTGCHQGRWSARQDAGVIQGRAGRQARDGGCRIATQEQYPRKACAQEVRVRELAGKREAIWMFREPHGRMPQDGGRSGMADRDVMVQGSSQGR